MNVSKSKYSNPNEAVHLKSAVSGGKRLSGLRLSVRRLLRWMVCALVLAVLWVGYAQWRMMTQQDTFANLPPRDVGIVLGASLRKDVPSPALRERLDHAADLYLQGRVSKLIVSGGYDRPSSKLTEAEGMQAYLLQQGVPAEDIILENRARSTYENLRFSQLLMQEHGLSSSVIITHRYHSFRALQIARDLDYSLPVVSPMDSSVLWMSWHRGRETLALTKWQWDRAALLFGVEPQG